MGRRSPRRDQESFSPPPSPSLTWAPDLQININGSIHPVNKRCMAAKSAMLAKLDSTSSTISYFEFPPGAPADPRAFRAAVWFCHGGSVPDFTPETVVPLACMAAYLRMTDDHCPGNLFTKTVAYLSERVLPYWNETIEAFRGSESVFDTAQQVGIVSALFESITEKVAADPGLLDDPADQRSTHDAGSEERPQAAFSRLKRRLFHQTIVEHHPSVPPEDLTSLPLYLFVPAIIAIREAGSVPEDAIARCVYRYSVRWARAAASTGSPPQTPAEVETERSRQRDVLEVTQRLLPETLGALHVKYLVDLLRRAAILHTPSDCRYALEARIARQLPEASATDLLLPPCGYATETAHDVESARRIVARFCSEHFCSVGSDPGDLPDVAGLVGEFLPMVAVDPGLKKETFTALLGMLADMQGPADAVYRAIDAYLIAHGGMTESEREEVCKVMDVKGLSAKACEHAARNERLPVRVVTRVLLVGQLRIREVMKKALQDMEDNEPEEEEKVMLLLGHSVEEEEEEEEIVNMDGRVMKLEKECGKIKEEIQKCSRSGEFGDGRDDDVPGVGVGGSSTRRKGAAGLWKELSKLKLLGCKGGVGSVIDDCRCNGKKRKVMQPSPGNKKFKFSF